LHTEVSAHERIMVALDVDTELEVRTIVEWLVGKVGYFKIGSQLFTRMGPTAAKLVRQLGGKVFLDLKWHDIENTVQQAVRAATDLDVAFFDLHTSNALKTLRSASAARGSAAALGISVLTDLDDKESKAIYRDDCQATVARLTNRALEGNLQGVVCSVHEASFIRKFPPNDRLLIVTPGIRLDGDNLHDQKRIASPRAAILAGADYLVIGRALTEAGDPFATLDRIVTEITTATFDRLSIR